MVYADDVKLLGDNIDTMKKNTEALTDARNRRRENQVYVAISSPACWSISGHKNSKQII
jgi:hypothetical protein